MRENPKAGEAFGKLHELCIEMTPGDFELILHVDVEGGSRV
jgi:hypothetical protein